MSWVKARAAILRQAGQPLSIELVEVPEPRVGEVLVRYRASGICHSDEHARLGHYPVPKPIVLGHEGAGVVEAVGPGVTAFRAGDRVVATCAPSCGCCHNCQIMLPIFCEHVEEIWRRPVVTDAAGEAVHTFFGIGTFAEYATVHERSLIRADFDLPDDQLALFGCAVQTGLGAVFNAGDVQPGQTVAVSGCGGVGQSIIQGARVAGASRIIAVDPSPLKRELALASGATDVVDPMADDPAEAARSATNGRGVDVSFEAVGRGDTMRQAWTMARIAGTVVPLGVGGSDPLGIAPADFVGSAKRWRPSHYCEGFPRIEVPRFMEMAALGKLDLSLLVSRQIRLEDVNEGLKALEGGEVVRSVIMM
jgi:S-(hydroxymethyl)glutathione dehydrogenase / alcohol dehydrogenase